MNRSYEARCHPLECEQFGTAPYSSSATVMLKLEIGMVRLGVGVAVGTSRFNARLTSLNCEDIVRANGVDLREYL